MSTHARLLLPGIAAAGLSCGGSSPPAPSVPQSLDGLWTGRYEVIECVTTHFDSRGCAHNRLGDVILRISTNGETVEGDVQFRIDQGNALMVGTCGHAPLPVEGTLDSARLALGGADRQTQPRMCENELRDWLTLVGADGRMNGSATGIQRQVSAGGASNTWTRTFNVTSLARQEGARVR